MPEKKNIETKAQERKPRSFKQKFWKFSKWVVIIYCLVGITLYYAQDYFILQSEKLPPVYSFSFNGKMEELNIPFNERDTINLVKFFTANVHKRGLVLYFHGNKDNISHYTRFVPSFTSKGYDVWMADYPGYGKSSGEFTEKKLYSIAYQLQKLAMQQYSSDSIIIYGKSLGTAVAAYTATVRPFKMLLLETPYYSMPYLMRQYAFIYPVNYMSHFQFPTYRFLPDVAGPVVIFHGTDDGIVPFNNSEQLQQFLKPSDLLLRIEGGSHNDLSTFPAYNKALDSLLSL